MPQWVTSKHDEEVQTPEESDGRLDRRKNADDNSIFVGSGRCTGIDTLPRKSSGGAGTGHARGFKDYMRAVLCLQGYKSPKHRDLGERLLPWQARRCDSRYPKAGREWEE